MLSWACGIVVTILEKEVVLVKGGWGIGHDNKFSLSEEAQAIIWDF